jgi:hypothetical protein
MADDLTAEEFRHQPVAGANSAAWVVGHLALTARRTAERLGATELPALPEGFAERFSTTKQPAGAQADLGGKEELLSLLDACVDKIIAALPAAPGELLDGPPTIPNRFAATFGEGLLFGALHFAMHAGQLSTIRRSLGKPPQV